MHPLLSRGGAGPSRLIIAGIAVLANLGFYLPHVPHSPGSSVVPVDKIVHALVFALTVWGIGRLLAPWERFGRRFPIGWVVVIALVHAVFVELFQAALLPGRSGDVADVFADLVGIAIGLGAWWWERRVRAGRAAAVTSPADGSRRHGPVPSPR